jgi:hypothetical protein
MRHLLILGICVFCAACTQSPNRAKFEEEISDLAPQYPAGFHTLVRIGDEYCALMATGKYQVDGGGHSSDALNIATQTVDKGKIFGGADGTMIRTVTANTAQKYLCPATR